MSSTINEIHTTCKDCNFAQFEDNKQTGCLLGLLERFTDVVGCYDEEKEFSVINNAMCIFKDNMPEHKKEIYDKEALIKKLDDLMEFKYRVLLFCDETNKEEFDTSINSILMQEIKPEHVTIISRKGAIYEIDDIKAKFEGTGINWRYEVIMDNKLTKRDLIDWIIFDKKVYSNWYVTLDQSTSFNPSFSIWLSDEVKDKTKKVKYVYVYPDNDSPMSLIVHTLYHQFVYGNKGERVEEKITSLTRFPAGYPVDLYRKTYEYET